MCSGWLVRVHNRSSVCNLRTGCVRGNPKILERCARECNPKNDPKRVVGVWGFAPIGTKPCRPHGNILPPVRTRRYRAVQHQTEGVDKLVCIVPVRRVPLAEFPALRAPEDHGAGLALFPSAHIRNGPTLFCMTRMRVVGVIPAPPPCCIGIRGGTLSQCCFADGSCMGCGSIRC